jgi:AraC-like DNA-binding protein
MTVSAYSVKDQSRAATTAAPSRRTGPVARAHHGLVDLRGGASTVRAGTYLHEAPDLVTGWHRHDLHEVVYAFEGVAEVETERFRYLLPPQRAMWIPAGLEHCTTLNRVRSVAVLFDPKMIRGTGTHARVVGVAPVLREMMIHATRWPISRPHSDPAADAFFEALAGVTREAIEEEAPLCLPNSADPVVQAIMAATQADLAGITSERVCAAVGISQRTLRRRFRTATRMPWQEYLLASRMLRAMSLLTERRRSVLEVSIEVGFESASAFSRSFARFAGETPSAYRKRVAT